MYAEYYFTKWVKISKTDMVRVNSGAFEGCPTPIYIIEEKKLRDNLRLIAEVASRSDVEIILAFKAFALWKVFPIFREYIHSTTASSY